MTRCVRCSIIFDSIDELNRHKGLEHSDKTKTQEIEIFPLLDNITMVTFMVIITIIFSNILFHYILLNDLSIIEAAYLPMGIQLYEQREAKKNYHCPKCKYPLNTRFDDEGISYQCCSNDLCSLS